MKKLYLQNGKEVKIGDSIIITRLEKETPYGKIALIGKVPLDKKLLPDLIKAGIVIEKRVIPTDLDYYISKVADRLGEDIDTVYRYFNLLDAHYPLIPVSMLLKEIAIELNKDYDSSIKDSDEVWAISLTNGEATKLNKAHIKSYTGFASFRNKEDVMLAHSILKDILKDIFHE